MSTLPEAPTRPQVGAKVQISSPNQIAATLDENGCCGGLPFMPEMSAYVGQQFIVDRWANSLCVMGDTIEFRKLEDCVVLQMPRCTGSAHGRCQMGCTFLWHTHWLCPNEPQVDSSDPISNGLPTLNSVVADTCNDGEYHCQATQLRSMTRPQGSLVSRLGDELNLNGIGAGRIATDLCSSLIAKVTRQSTGFAGPCSGRTPSQPLDLQVGDKVRVRDLCEIIGTLNEQGKNRGLWFDPKMAVYCDSVMSVTRRVEHFIDEQSGKMIHARVPSIVLDEQHCDGQGRKYCARLLHYFWREIWLERVT